MELKGDGIALRGKARESHGKDLRGFAVDRQSGAARRND